MMFINDSKKLMKDEKDKRAKENPNGLNFANFGIVVAYKMWKNRGACKQLHEKKNNIKRKKTKRKKLVKVLCSHRQNTSFIEV